MVGNQALAHLARIADAALTTAVAQAAAKLAQAAAKPKLDCD